MQHEEVSQNTGCTALPGEILRCVFLLWRCVLMPNAHRRRDSKLSRVGVGEVCRTNQFATTDLVEKVKTENVENLSSRVGCRIGNWVWVMNADGCRGRPIHAVAPPHFPVSSEGLGRKIFQNFSKSQRWNRVFFSIFCKLKWSLLQWRKGRIRQQALQNGPIKMSSNLILQTRLHGAPRTTVPVDAQPVFVPTPHYLHTSQRICANLRIEPYDDWGQFPPFALPRGDANGHNSTRDGKLSSDYRSVSKD